MFGYDEKGEYTFQDGKIETVADIVDIVSRPTMYLSDILDDDTPNGSAPLGRNHHGAPRPFPHGIWFRGQSNVDHLPIPSVFRPAGSSCYDEREMFADLRLRASNIDLRGYNNIELMCVMQHHSLPTRLMDWSESPLVASLFATSSPYYKLLDGDNPKKFVDMDVKRDAALYVLNAYRLNAYTNLSMHRDANIFNPQEIDVVLRTLMAEHTYLESILAKIKGTQYLSYDHVAFTIDKELEAIRKKLDDAKENAVAYDPQKDPGYSTFFQRLAAPVAVIPRRNHARMDAQLSCFTVHGGKLYLDRKGGGGFQHAGMNLMNHPIHLHELNHPDKLKQIDSLNSPRTDAEYRPFMLKFQISSKAVSRIMIELDRMGVNDAMIFPDIQNQSQHSKRRWRIEDKRPIFSLPFIRDALWSSQDMRPRPPVDDNHMQRLYGVTNDGIGTDGTRKSGADPHDHEEASGVQ